MLFSLLAAVVSNGFLEADEITHFLNAQKMWFDGRALVSIWGRMGCTGFYGLVAPLGLVPARLLAVGVTGLTGLGTTVVLRYFLQLPALGYSNAAAPVARSWVRRHAVAIAWLLLFAQPLFLLNSFTIMTEMQLACCWIWAAAILILCRRWRGGGIVLASLVLGLGGLMRPEGWIAVACWPAVAWLWLSRPGRRRLGGGGEGLSAAHLGTRGRAGGTLLATFMAGAPSLAWYGVGLWVYQDWLWVLHTWPWSPASQYGKTGLMFLLSLTVSMGVWMWWPIGLGIRDVLKRGDAAERQPARRQEAALLLVLPLVGLFLMHGVLGTLGLFGSMSLPRYFISVAPMAAILGVLGWARVEARGRRAASRGLKIAVVGLPLLTPFALVATGYLPAWKTHYQRRLDVAVAEVKKRVAPADYEDRLIIGHPYVIYALGMKLGTFADRRVFSPAAIANAPKGTLLVIEQYLWINEGRAGPHQLEAWGYRSVESVAKEADAIHSAMEPLELKAEAGVVRVWEKQ
jgi:hypothetical protein